MTAGLWLFLFRIVAEFFHRKPEQAPQRDPEVQVITQTAQTVDLIKVAIRLEEERIRAKTAQATAAATRGDSTMAIRLRTE